MAWEGGRQGSAIRSFVLSVCMAGVAALGQVGGGGSWRIEVAPKVKDLRFNAGARDPRTGEWGVQDAVFSLSAVGENVPPNAVIAYRWEIVYDPTGEPLRPPPAQGWLLIDPPGNGPNAVGHAYDGPGLYYAYCEVSVTVSGQGTWSVGLLKQCAAVGGPLTFDVFDGVEGPPRWDDYNFENPWYLQYFGYHPLAPPPDPPGQPIQKGRAAIRYGQPEGVTFEWLKEGPVVWTFHSAPNLGDSGEVKFGATDGSGKGEIRVKVRYSMVYDGETWGPFEDDTDETPPPGEKLPRLTYRQFTAHKPKDTRSVFKEELPRQLQFQPYVCVDRYWMVLLDHLGEPMPRVWVQERFHDQNGDPLPWWRTNGFNMNPDGKGWVTFGDGQMAPNGDNFTGGFWDDVGSWKIAVWFPHGLSNPIWDFYHSYFGGTKTIYMIPPSQGGGLYAGTWRIRAWTDFTEHTKTSGG